MLATLIPLEQLEQSAVNQIYDALNLPFMRKLAIMPDCHTGYSLPIGGVALLHKVISPAYVGYDIGCGMCFVETNTKVGLFTDDFKDIFNEIYAKIPVGFNSRENMLDYKPFNSASGNKELNKKVRDKLHVQLGTLGGGNHFIEIGRNTNGILCVTIHSGSRNPGHSVASYYMKLSKTVDKTLPNGFLRLNGEHGQAYLKDMEYMQDYALENRKIIMKKVMDILGLRFSKYKMYNENHNHAIVTEDGVLHRKGATPADKGQIGIIPGNMRDGVYVTEGLGNKEYLSSASHGAGRLFSRKKAKETITFSDFRDTMKGIIAKVDKSTLDESPFAYKNLDDIIAMQDGIVIDVLDKVKPLINVKG